MNLLLLLGAWFAAGVLTTLLIGPRLRRAAEAAGTPLEPEPVFPAGRSPLRWRLGTLGVVGLLAGSTGMAAAGALPGSAQTIAHHVLGSVGMHVPKDSAPEVVAAPATPPWGDVAEAPDAPTTSELAVGEGSTSAPPPAGVQAEPPEGSATAGDTDGTTGSATDTGADAGADAGEPDASPPSSTLPSTEPSDVPDDGTGDEPSDVPADPPSDEPTTTTTTPPTDPPGDPGDVPTSSTTTTTTTTTVPPDAPPPPPPPPAG